MSTKHILIALASIKLSLLGYYLFEEKVFTISEKVVVAKEKKIKKKVSQGNDATKESIEYSNDVEYLLSIKPDATKHKKDEMEALLKKLTAMRQHLITEIDVLNTREETLKNLDSSVQKKLEMLEQEKLFIANSLQKEKEIKAERVDTLSKVFEKMEPKKAAPIFAKLDQDLAVQIFLKIPQKMSTKIMESLPPDESVKLSEYLSRISSAREYDILERMNKIYDQTFCENSTPKDTL